MENRPIDILMPIQHGRYVRGDTVERLLAQDRDFHWYVDAGIDLEVSDKEVDVIGQVVSGQVFRNQLTHAVKIMFKRNRLLKCGNSKFVYMADADIRLSEIPVFGGILRAFEANKNLGAVGVPYSSEWPYWIFHVAAGAMMVRRSDLEEIGVLRATPCECAYIKNRLTEKGKFTLPLINPLLRGTEWKATDIEGDSIEYEVKYSGPDPVTGEERNSIPEDQYVDLELPLKAGEPMPLDFLREAVKKHGRAFKIWVKTET